MRLNTKKLAIMTIFAALYAVGVIALAGISFGYGIFQVRVADAMLPLSMIFGFPSAIGLSLGCVVSNVYGGFGLIDIVGGSVANLIACILAWYIGRNGGKVRRFAATIVQTVVISLIVGPYLAPILNVNIWLSIFAVLVGEIVAINIIGYPLQEAIRRNKIFTKYS
jgi:uncharacterized membrane protein